MKSIKSVVEAAWPEWEITREIGIGTYGIVYEAKREDQYIGREYAAIKAIPVPKDNDELNKLMKSGKSLQQSLNQFQQVVKDCTNEITIMNRIRHCKNIVALEDYKVIEADGGDTWYILIRMELLMPLPRYMVGHPFQEADIIKLGIDLCSALDICRKHSIVHWDIKPENVFVDTSGDFKLGDFGLAWNMERQNSNHARNTFSSFTAPELLTAQFDNAILNAAFQMDIFSLGMLLYWVANNGKLPFPDESEQSLYNKNHGSHPAQRVCGEDLPPLSGISGQLQYVIKKACSCRPEDRYASAAEMRAALVSLLPQKGQKPPSPYDDRGTLDEQAWLEEQKKRGQHPGQDSEMLNETVFDWTDALEKTATDTTAARSKAVYGNAKLDETLPSDLTSGSKKPLKKQKADPAPFDYGSQSEKKDIRKDTEPAKPKKKRHNPLIIISIAMLALAVILFVWWLINRQNKSTDMVTDDTTITEPADDSPGIEADGDGDGSGDESEDGSGNETEDASDEGDGDGSGEDTGDGSGEGVGEGADKAEDEPSDKQILIGDVNGDGSIDVMDVIRLQKYLSGWSVSVDLENSDISGDGEVNVMDVIRLQKLVTEPGSQ